MRSRWLWLLLAPALLLLALLLIRESLEPHLLLYLDDLLRPKPPPATLPLNESLAVRLYSDTRPHTGKVARLQKGLVLVVDGEALVEEGFGFGLPLVEVDGQAYLSRAATVEQRGQTLVKRYEMDTVDTPSGFLRRKYEPVPPIGTVTVTYTVTSGSLIDVAVDLTGLQVTPDRVYLMNEQGARAFTRYEEPGLVAEGQELGKWQPTTAQEGCLVATERSTRFCVLTSEAVPRYYGRERYNQYYPVGVYVLSWAGIDLALDPPPDHFAYQIQVER